MNQPRHTPPVRQRGHWNRNFSPLKFRLRCLTYNLPITAVIVVFVFVSLCSSFDASLSPDLITECSFSSLIVQFYPSFDAESANKSREDSVRQHSSMHLLFNMVQVDYLDNGRCTFWPHLSSWDSGKASCGLSTIAELTVSSVTPCLLSVTADDERPLLNNVPGLHEIM